MLAHVIGSARNLGASGIHVVYGHGGDQVRAEFAGQSDLQWAEQAQQLGTGHAVQQAMPQVPDEAQVLVLYADVPLITENTLRHLLTVADAGTAVLAETLADPTGYGRVLVDAKGLVQAIVEQKDADDAQKAVKQINTGVVCAGAADLKRWLGALGNDNAQGEYYLTDIFAMAARDGKPANAAPCLSAGEADGANDPVQLATLERRYQLRQAEALMLQGVRLSDPARLDVRGRVTVGRDVEIDVNVILEGEVVLRDGVRIGPFCRLKDVDTRRRYGGAGTLRFRRCDSGCRQYARPVRTPSAGYGTRRRNACRQFRGNQEIASRQGLEGQSPELYRRCRDRREREYRRRHHHLQLRRSE